MIQDTHIKVYLEIIPPGILQDIHSKSCSGIIPPDRELDRNDSKYTFQSLFRNYSSWYEIRPGMM